MGKMGGLPESGQTGNGGSVRKFLLVSDTHFLDKAADKSRDEEWGGVSDTDVEDYLQQLEEELLGQEDWSWEEQHEQLEEDGILEIGGYDRRTRKLVTRHRNKKLLEEEHLEMLYEQKAELDAAREEVVGEVIDELERYYDEHGCDGLVLGGDLGKYTEDIERILDREFDDIKIAQGNHDLWEIEAVEDRDGVDCVDDGEILYWEEDVGGETYRIALAHKPADFNTRGVSPESAIGHEYRDVDIILHGHSHFPWDKGLSVAKFHHERAEDEPHAIEDNLLCIGMGSTYINHNVQDALPEKSIQVLTLGETEFTDDGSGEGRKKMMVEHLDFEGEVGNSVVEKAGYQLVEEEFPHFEEVRSYCTWPGGRGKGNRYDNGR